MQFPAFQASIDFPLDAPGPRRRPVTQEQLDALFQQAAAIVRAELARPITLASVARRLASSPRQLRRAFTQTGGTSFRSFLQEERMSRAAELLLATDLPVSKVAARVGYRQATQFTKAFKRTHSATPSEFRTSGRRARPHD